MIRKTPLNNFNVAHGGRMVDFAGWSMPVQYKSIVEEHKSTRSAAGLFDVSHMGEALVSGREATDYLDFVLTNDISKMSVGQALYSLMCFEHGGVVDDLLVYKKSETEYLLCLNASNTEKDLAWLESKRDRFDAALSDVSSDFALLALQGPKTFEILQDLEAEGSEGLRYYHFTEGSVAGLPCLISRTGYTGEKGVELFVAPENAAKLAESILLAGESHGLVLAGLGARDSLRLEAGYSLYGHEINEDISPVQANLMWTVKLNKASDFIGKAAILAEKDVGPKKKIVFFKTGSRRIVRSDTEVQTDGRTIGTVVSGTFSPELNEAIGSALINSECSEAELSVDMRGKSMRIFQTKPPFIEVKP